MNTFIQLTNALDITTITIRGDLIFSIEEFTAESCGAVRKINFVGGSDEFVYVTESQEQILKKIQRAQTLFS